MKLRYWLPLPCLPYPRSSTAIPWPLTRYAGPQPPAPGLLEQNLHFNEVSGDLHTELGKSCYRKCWERGGLTSQPGPELRWAMRSTFTGLPNFKVKKNPAIFCAIDKIYFFKNTKVPGHLQSSPFWILGVEGQRNCWRKAGSFSFLFALNTLNMQKVKLQKELFAFWSAYFFFIGFSITVVAHKECSIITWTLKLQIRFDCGTYIILMMVITT